MISENSKIGIALVIIGITLYIMGFIFLCDRTLLLLGNLCFLGGLFSLIGFFGSLKFFLSKGKALGSLIFFVGNLLTLLLNLAGIRIAHFYWLQSASSNNLQGSFCWFWASRCSGLLHKCTDSSQCSETSFRTYSTTCTLFPSSARVSVRITRAQRVGSENHFLVW